MCEFPPEASSRLRIWFGAGTDNATRVCASRVNARHGTRPDNWLSPRLTGVPVSGHLYIGFAYGFD